MIVMRCSVSVSFLALVSEDGCRAHPSASLCRKLTIDQPRPLRQAVPPSNSQTLRCLYAYRNVPCTTRIYTHAPQYTRTHTHTHTHTHMLSQCGLLVDLELEELSQVANSKAGGNSAATHSFTTFDDHTRTQRFRGYACGCRSWRSPAKCTASASREGSGVHPRAELGG